MTEEEFFAKVQTPDDIIKTSSESQTTDSNPKG